MDKDFILPDDNTFRLLKEGYDQMMKGKYTAVGTLSTPDFGHNIGVKMAENLGESGVLNHSFHRAPLCAGGSTKLLVLYFALTFVYNLGYGTAISYTHSRMGGVQPQKRSFRDVNGLF